MNFIKIARREAKKARHRQHKFGAVLIRGGNMIAASHNHSFVHGEHSVLDRAWKSGTEGSTLLVIRVKRDGTLGMAWPCDVCLRRMCESGVKKVIYSDADGLMKEIKLSTIHDHNPQPIVYPYMLPYYDSISEKDRYELARSRYKHDDPEGH